MPRKILIIDDEDDIREVAALSLETVAGLGSHQGQLRCAGPGPRRRAPARRHPARRDDARHGRSDDLPRAAQ